MPDTKKELNTYVIVENDGTEHGTFKGRQPRQAARKVINTLGGTKDKPTRVRLRERGTKKLHVFEGYKEKVAAPEKRPVWVPAMVNKPFVKKIGVEHIEDKPVE